MSRREYGQGTTLFDNIDALNPRVETYAPTDLPEREEELDEIHSALRPVELGGTPINLLIYGDTGQGKTAAVGLETRALESWAKNEDITVNTVTIECKGLDKSYNALTNLVKNLREIRHGPGEDLPVGYQRKQLLNLALEEMEKIGGTIIVILDEIDALGEDDYILYELPRAEVDGVKLSLIAITNDLTYRDNLDSDARSSLAEDEIVFAPYDSYHLQEILARRSSIALHETGFSCEDCESPDCEHDIEESYENLVSNVITDDVVPLCAAFAAQDTGDARYALRLMLRATRFADNAGDPKVTEDHVREAQEYLEEKAIATGIKTLPYQKIATLMTVAYEHVRDSEPGHTTDLYDRYKKYCRKTDMEARSKKRFKEFLEDHTGEGLLRTDTGGGQGVENEYWVDVDIDLVLKHLPSEEERLGGVAENIRNHR